MGPRRERAFSDSEEPWAPRKKLLDEVDNFPADLPMKINTQGQAVINGAELVGGPTEVPADNSTVKPKRRQKSGWTRQRRKRAIEKIQALAAAEAEALQEGSLCQDRQTMTGTDGCSPSPESS